MIERGPLVSVILPAFDRLRFLRSCVDSVLRQTFRDWELIVVDDGSGLQTRAYLEELPAGSSRVRVIHLSHTGNPARVRNAGVSQARGRYLAFIDSDDVWLPRKLELQLPALRADGRCRWSYTAFTTVDAHLVPLPVKPREPPARGWIFGHLVRMDTLIALPSVIAERALVQAAGGFDEQQWMCEDYDLWLKLASASPVHAVSEPLVLVRRHREHTGDDVSAYRGMARVLKRLRQAELPHALAATVQRRRAQVAGGLALSLAVSGQTAAAVRAIATSVGHSWRHPSWWRGVAAAIPRILVPRTLRAAIRGRQGTRTAGPLEALRVLWQLLGRGMRVRLIGLQCLSVLMAACTVSGIAAVLPFLAVLSDPSLLRQSAVLQLALRHLPMGGPGTFTVALGAAFALAVAVANAINLLGSIAISRFCYDVGDHLQISLFAEYLRRDYLFHLQSDSARLSSNVIYETGRVAAGLLQGALTLIANLVTVLFIVASMLVLNPRIALWALLALGLSYAAIYGLARGRLRRNGLAETRNFSKRSKVVTESLGSIREISLSRTAGYFVAQFAGFCKPISGSAVSTLAIAQAPRYVLEVVTAGTLVALAIGASRAGEGSASWIPQLSFIGLAAYRLLPALQQIFAAAVRVRADLPAYESVAADLRAPPRVLPAARPPAAGVPGWQGWPRREIRLDGVSFRYRPEGPDALSGISLSIEAGSTLGIVGANGSGKSTLADLLAGLLVPAEGRIEVDGAVLDSTHLDRWRSGLGYVPQRVAIVDTSVAGNIALGVEPAAIDWGRLWKAARLARLEEWVQGLPQGFLHILGEHGGRLSGGERQRLGLARALYNDPSVLILDEATASLDAATEREIVDALENLARSRTVVLISHRWSSLRHCDVIVELDRGRISRTTHGPIDAPVVA